LSVRRIAKEADVSTMNVYSRFGGKEGVLDELFADGYRRLFSMLDEICESDDPIADLSAAAAAYRRFALANPTYYCVMFRQGLPQYAPSPKAAEVAYRDRPLFEALIRRAQQAGAITSEFDAADIAAGLWAECHGHVSLELDGIRSDRIDWASVFEIGVGATITGLRPSETEALCA
jgi:AcrR family transcriptional regulator